MTDLNTNLTDSDIALSIPEIADITTERVNFDEMEQDIQRFASNDAVRVVLEKGVDLQNYGVKIQESLEEAEQASINDYLKQIDRVKNLHQEISTCDNALETMEDLLMQFKQALGQISSDIDSLQTKSQEITIKLNNRKNVDKFLHEFTKHITVTNYFQDKIKNSEVSSDYVKLLHDLNDKLQFIKKPEVCKTPAAREASSILEKLKSKASDNIKKWIMNRTNKLRDAFNRENDNSKPAEFEPDEVKIRF